MGLGADNLAILERSITRARTLVESDSSLRSAMPSLEAFQRVIDCRTSIEIVQRAMEIHGDRPAIGYRKHEITVDGATGRRVARLLPAFGTISYRALWDRIELLSSGLVQGGMARPGDIVGLVGSSTVDHVVAELACHHLAAASVPLAKNVAARELEVILNETESTVLFCSVEQLLPAARSLQACPGVRTLVVIDLVQQDDAHLELVEQARAVLGASRPNVAITVIAEVEALGARAGRVPPVIPAEGADPLLSLVYTSGSTGTPKGAMFTERSWHARWSTLPFLELAALPMISVVFLPQNHMGGRNAVANSLKLGGLACFTHGSDMSTLFEDIRLVRPTYLHLVPRLSELIYQHFQREVARRGRERAAAAGGEVIAEVMAEMRERFLGGRMLLALTASAPTPPEVSAFIRQGFDIPIVDVFAGTEYGQILVDRRVNRHNVLDVKLVSVPELGYLDTDEPYPRGELYVKTARRISSYFKNEAATRELVDPSGFLRTGDIFERRGPDELVWIDRKNNVQKLAQGEFVNIWKLESLFATGSRFIKQVYIQGNSARSYLLAVIVPEPAEVAAEAEAEATPATAESTIKSILRAELHRLASAHGLEPYEIPRDFLVELEPFSRDNGLLTSLGKPSRPRLKAKYGPAIDRMYEQLDRQASAATSLPQDEALPVAARVRRTIAAILGLPESSLEASRSFRSFGGDSIAGANLCASVQREYGVRLSVGFVLGPEAAIADLCREIESRLDGPDPAAAVGAATATAFERIHGPSPDLIRAHDLRLERFLDEGAVKRPAEVPALPEARAVLLTGATGFLGRFLCLELLERAARTGGEVYCLIRARSDAEAAHRLAEVYRPGSALHERFAALAAGRLHVLAGDLEQPRLGLPDARYRQLSEDVDTIVHAAALVNHALPYAQLFEANVLGTAWVMRLALEGRPKRFNYTSTNSVSLALLRDRELALETDDTRALGDGWPAAATRHASGYQLSKWAGEVLAQDLFETFDLPVNVFRCNLILPPARAREQINTDDFLTRLISSVISTGLYPRSFYERTTAAPPPHLDGFPVDFIAAAIAAIAAGPPRGHAVYHVNNVHWDDGVSLDSVMSRLSAAGYPLARVDDHAAWFQRFEQALRELPAARQAASSLPILEQWRTPLAMDQRRRIDAARFRAQVQASRPHDLDDIPHLDDAYFDRCIEDLRRLGLIGVPPRS